MISQSLSYHSALRIKAPRRRGSSKGRVTAAGRRALVLFRDHGPAQKVYRTHHAFDYTWRIQDQPVSRHVSTFHKQGFVALSKDGMTARLTTLGREVAESISA